MGTLNVNRFTYAVDDHALACLSRTLTALRQEGRVVDVVLVFADEDLTVRITTESVVSIVVLDGAGITDDVAGLLISEYITMGRLRFVCSDPVRR